MHRPKVGQRTKGVQGKRGDRRRDSKGEARTKEAEQRDVREQEKVKGRHRQRGREGEWRGSKGGKLAMGESKTDGGHKEGKE